MPSGRKPKSGKKNTINQQTRLNRKTLIVPGLSPRIPPSSVSSSSSSSSSSASSHSFHHVSPNPVVGLEMVAGTSRPGRLGPFKRTHRILLVGEGDFGFSRMLSLAMGSATNLCSTSYDSNNEMLLKYGEQALATVNHLHLLGATVLYQVDAATLHSHPQIIDAPQSPFDRVVFNFPHVGGSTDADIKKNQELVLNFLSSSRALLLMQHPSLPDMVDPPQIMIALRSTPFYDKWNIEGLAKTCGLKMQQKIKFDSNLFGGYVPQRTKPSTTRAEAPMTHNAYYTCFQIDPTITPKHGPSHAFVFDAPIKSTSSKISPLNLLSIPSNETHDQKKEGKKTIKDVKTIKVLPSSSSSSSLASMHEDKLNNNPKKSTQQKSIPKSTPTATMSKDNALRPNKRQRPAKKTPVILDKSDEGYRKLSGAAKRKVAKLTANPNNKKPAVQLESLSRKERKAQLLKWRVKSNSAKRRRT